MLSVATLDGGARESVHFWCESLASGLAFANPRPFPWTLANSPTGRIARELGVRGPTFTLVGRVEALTGAFEHALEELTSSGVEKALLVAVRWNLGGADAPRRGLVVVDRRWGRRRGSGSASRRRAADRAPDGIGDARRGAGARSARGARRSGKRARRLDHARAASVAAAGPVESDDDDPRRAQRPRGPQAPRRLTALAIVLGVAMVSGTYVLTDTIDKAFDAIFVDSYAGTDAVVTGKEPDISFEGESTPKRRRSPEDVARRASAARRRRGRDGHRRRTRQTKILGRTARRSTRSGAPSLRLRDRDRARGRPLQPAQARRGPLARRRRRGRRSTRAPPTSEDYAVGDRIGDRGARPGAGVRVVRHREVRRRELARQRDVRDLRRPDGPEAARQGGELDAIQVAGAEGSTPGAADRADRGRSSGRRRRCVPAPRRRRRTRSDIGELHDVHPLLPARVRGHRALRRRLRHLQHALDHGRAADARVRDAADDRRLAAADPPLGDPRGARDRLPRLGRRPLPRPRRSPSGSTRCSRRSTSTCRRRTRSSPRARSSSRCSSGRRHAARRPLPGDPRDAGAADRGRARGLRRCRAVALLALHAVRRARPHRRSRSSCSATRCSRTTSSTGARLLSIAGRRARCSSSAWR